MFRFFYGLGVAISQPLFLIMGENIMIKFIIGVGLTTLLLFGLIFVPFFIDYYRLSNLFFGMNNLIFIMGGFVIGFYVYQEFFTDEIPEPPKSFKANRKLDSTTMPMATRKSYQDFEGGRNAN